MSTNAFTKNNITINNADVSSVYHGSLMHRCSMMLMSALFLFYKYILVFFPSVISHDLMKFYNIDATQLGILASCYFYPYIIMQIVAGILLDKYSPRLLTTFAIILSAISLFWFSKAQTLCMAELARGLMGFSASFASSSYLKLAANWFSRKHYSILAGLLASAAMIGALFSTTLLAFYVQIIGWRLTLNYCSWLGLLFAFIYWIIVRDNPIFSADSSVTFVQSLKNMMGVVKNRGNLLLSIYCGLMFSPIEIFCGLWGVPFLLKSYNLSLSEAAYSISVTFIGLTLGSPLISWYAEKIKNKISIMRYSALLCLMTIVLILYFPQINYCLLVILLFLFGFGAGSFMLGFTIARDINAIALAAFTMAIINSFEAFWSAFSDSLIGKFLDLGWNGEMHDHVHVYSAHNYKIALSILVIYFSAAYLILNMIKRYA